MDTPPVGSSSSAAADQSQSQGTEPLATTAPVDKQGTVSQRHDHSGPAPIAPGSVPVYPYTTPVRQGLLADRDREWVRMSSSANFINAALPIVAYGDEYPVILGREHGFWAKFEYGGIFPPGVAPDVAFRFAVVQLEDEEGTLYDREGNVVFTRADEGNYTSPDGVIEFKINNKGEYVDLEGHLLLTQDLEEIFLAPNGQVVATQDHYGTITFNYYDRQGIFEKSEVLTGPTSGQYYNSHYEHVLTRSINGEFYDASGLHLTTVVNTVHTIDDAGDVDMAMALKSRLIATEFATARTDDEGALHFHAALPMTLKGRKDLMFTYTFAGGKKARGGTALHPMPLDASGHAAKPALLVDLDFIRRFNRQERAQWAALLHDKVAPLYEIHFYARHDDAQKKPVKKWLRELGFEHAPISYQDRFGMRYVNIESRGARARAREINDQQSNGKLNGIPYVALIGDDAYDRLGGQWSGLITIAGRVHEPMEAFAQRIDSLLTDGQGGLATRVVREFENFGEAQSLTGRSAEQRDIRYASDNPYTHEDLEATAIFDGPAAWEAKLAAIRRAQQDDLILMQIFEYHFDDHGKELFAAIEEAVNRGARFYFQYDGLGSRIYPILVGKNKFHWWRELARKANRGLPKEEWRVRLIDQPILRDGGPAHVDHRKRLVVIYHRDWQDPDGVVRRVPYYLTEIAGRNIDASYFTNPPRPKILGRNDYRKVAKLAARYDGTIQIADNDFGEQNAWDVLYGMDLNEWASQPGELLSTSLGSPGGNGLPLVDGAPPTFEDYQRLAAPIIQYEYNVVSHNHPLFKDRIDPGSGSAMTDPQTGAVLKVAIESRRALAEYYWQTYRGQRDFRAWVLHHLAQNELVEGDFAYSPQGYREIYQKTLSELSALDDGRRPFAADDPRALYTTPKELIDDYQRRLLDSPTWQDEATLEATTGYDNLAIFWADPQIVPNRETVNAWSQLYLKAYSDQAVSYHKLIVDAQDREVSARIDEVLKLAYRAADQTDNLADMAVLGRRKAAIDFIFIYEGKRVRRYLTHFEEYKRAGFPNYWIKHFGSAGELATFWSEQKYFAQPALREVVMQAVADEFLGQAAFPIPEAGYGDMSYHVSHGAAGLEAGQGHLHNECTLCQNMRFFAESHPDNETFSSYYSEAASGILTAERELTPDSLRGVVTRLMDGRMQAEGYRDSHYFMAHLEDIAYLKAAGDFLARQDYQVHRVDVPERDGRNYFFAAIDGVRVNHEGAWKMDWRNERAFKVRMMQPDRSIFFMANNYPPKRRTVHDAIDIKAMYPEARVIFLTGPSSFTLDNIRRLPIKEMIDAGIEVWFTPNQEMHIKHGTGYLGSNNLDQASLNNSEIVFHTTDPYYIDAVTGDHVGQEILWRRAIPLHLLPPEQVDRILGFDGGDTGIFSGDLVLQFEYGG